MIERTPLWRILPVVQPIPGQPDKDFGFELTPGAHGIWTTEHRARLQINSLGLRDVEREVAKPAGTLRIGLLGEFHGRGRASQPRGELRGVGRAPAARGGLQGRADQLGDRGPSPIRQLWRLERRGYPLNLDVVLANSAAEVFSPARCSMTARTPPTCPRETANSRSAMVSVSVSRTVTPTICLGGCLLRSIRARPSSAWSTCAARSRGPCYWGCRPPLPLLNDPRWPRQRPPPTPLASPASAPQRRSRPCSIFGATIVRNCFGRRLRGSWMIWRRARAAIRSASSMRSATSRCRPAIVPRSTAARADLLVHMQRVVLPAAESRLIDWSAAVAEVVGGPARVPQLHGFGIHTGAGHLNYDGHRAWAIALIDVLRRELPLDAASRDLSAGHSSRGRASAGSCLAGRANQTLKRAVLIPST